MTIGDARQLTGREIKAERRRQRELAVALGYTASRKHQALFYLRYKLITFFVDFTNEHKDGRARPARFSWSWGENAPYEGTLTRKRAVLIEGMRLHGAGLRFEPSSREGENILLLRSMFGGGQR
jgi:hypothetical protein